MNLGAKYGFPTMIVVAVIADWHWHSFRAAWLAAGAIFYIWGVIRAEISLLAKYQAKAKNNAVFQVSEAAELGQMIGVIFSWVALLVAEMNQLPEQEAQDT